MDQEVCKKGAIWTYYTGKVINEQEKVSSTSRYIFEIPNGTDEPIYIDAADSNCGYGRYADDAMGSETENAKWEVIGTGEGVRLALIAITTIRKGMPIRAPYGWQYWYCPGNFPKELMQKAFRGYLEEIAADDNEELAWAFATATDFQDILIAKWGGTRGFATVDATDDSGNIHCAKSGIAGQTENIAVGKRSMSDNESEAKDLEQHTSQETRKRRREDAGLDFSDRQHRRTRRLRDRAIEQKDGVSATEQSRARIDTVQDNDIAQEVTERTTSLLVKDTSAPWVRGTKDDYTSRLRSLVSIPNDTSTIQKQKKRRRDAVGRDQADSTDGHIRRKRRLQDEAIAQQEGVANAGHSQSSSLACACDLLTDCTLPVIS